MPKWRAFLVQLPLLADIRNFEIGWRNFRLEKSKSKEITGKSFRILGRAASISREPYESNQAK